MKYIYSVLFILSVGCFSAEAQITAPKYSNEFLSIGVGARAIAMGTAQVSAVNDVTAGYWNPAGLVEVKEFPQLSLMHAEYFAGNSKYDYAGVAMPLKGKNRTLGISAFRFATDDIAYTIDYIQPDGSFDEFAASFTAASAIATKGKGLMFSSTELPPSK